MLQYSLSQAEVGQEGDVILPGLFSNLGESVHHSGIGGGGGEEEEGAKVLGLLETLLGQTKFTPRGGKLC